MKNDRSEASIPEIVLPDDCKWVVELYHLALDCAADNVMCEESLPEKRFMKEGFDQKYIYFWDTAFMALYAKYVPDFLPGVQSMDNFYAIQSPDGYIPRNYNFKQAKATFEGPGTNINPPLAAWAEYDSYRLSGDVERVNRVLPSLVALDRWIEANRRRKDGSWWFSDCAACGMDNSPRTARRNKYGNDVAYVDLAAQQALAAEQIARLAVVAGQDLLRTEFEDKYRERIAYLNAKHWCEKDGLYYDLLLQGKETENYPAYFSAAKTAAAFWPLLAGAVDSEKLERILGHLDHPGEFGRPYPVPSLSCDNPNYSATGCYWQGGVWAPVVYMVCRGLMRNGCFRRARELAWRHLRQIYDVYKNFSPHSIWECYSPEFLQPAENEHGEYARSHFCGWSALGPVALLIESLLGLEFDYPARKIIWRSDCLGAHGIRNLRFGKELVSVIAVARSHPGEVPEIQCNMGNEIEIIFEGLK